MMRLVDRYRIITFVPESHLENVVRSLQDSQMLGYGDYTDVLWFSSSGTEQFKPLEGSNPAQGKMNELERLNSIRLEFSIEKNDKKLEVLLHQYLLPARPWEEPVIYVTIVKENFKNRNDH